ncbi:MAG TPA: hypothetical protein VD999_05795 [Vitreimonas sp.]|nr:hypothetical protein [Vitreimonas sp.]
MKKINLETLEKEVEIKKLPIGKYVEVLKALNNLPKEISGLENITPEGIIQRLPSIIANSFDELCKIVSIATDMTDDEVKSISLDELTEIIITVIEVNKFASIADRVKKAFSLAPQKTSTMMSGSAG